MRTDADLHAAIDLIRRGCAPNSRPRSALSDPASPPADPRGQNQSVLGYIPRRTGVVDWTAQLHMYGLMLLVAIRVHRADRPAVVAGGDGTVTRVAHGGRIRRDRRARITTSSSECRSVARGLEVWKCARRLGRHFLGGRGRDDRRRAGVRPAFSGRGRTCPARTQVSAVSATGEPGLYGKPTTLPWG